MVLGPNFAAADLFPRACVLKFETKKFRTKFTGFRPKLCRRLFISTRMYVEIWDEEILHQIYWF